MSVKRLFFTLVVVLTCATMYGQSRRDIARYDVMNSEGVWAVGATIVPLTSLVHPAGKAYGGAMSSVGAMGFGIEGSYFVRDDWRATVELLYADNGYSTAFAKMGGESYALQSSFTVGALCYRHFGRWYAGAGVSFGRSSLKYRVATIAEAPNMDRFGEESFTQRKGSFGLVMSGGYLVSPFMKVGAFWRPSIAGGYAHSLGVTATIYIPFVEAVVCK